MLFRSTSVFNYSAPLRKGSWIWSASVSPDSKHVVINVLEGGIIGFNIYNMSTGKLIHTLSQVNGCVPWFTPDGHEICCVDSEDRWAIIKDSESNITKLEYLDLDTNPLGASPWKSPHGHQIADRWIISSSGKQLLWLPYNWRPTSDSIMWDGQFLAILNGLPEVVIFELPEK